MIRHINALNDTIKYRYHFNQLTDVEYPRYPANNVHYRYGTAADAATNAVGKIIFQEDASGFQTFKYGKLGEVTENIRTFALPFESQTYTFKMQYRYDSWNRIDSMIYPDGEVVTYIYNFGGMLESVLGSTPNHPYSYIDSITYNEFELKSKVFHGNGTRTQYAYDDLQRLQTLQSQTRARDAMQDITYTYDKVSNITGIDNFADLPGINFGGTYSHSYVYDSLYRLTYATGFWEDRPEHLRLVDTVQMSYHKNGRIIRKKVFAHTLSPLQMGVINYNRQYNYNTQQPNTLASMFDSISHTTHRFTWQSTGNLLTHTIPERRNMMEHSWTEDNRLQTVTDNNWFSYYQYDASGERTYKLPCGRTAGNRSGERSVYWYPADATLYVSPYLVITPQGYTKHYYAEGERVASQIGNGSFANITAFVTDTATANRKLHSANNMVRNLNPNITGATAQFAYLVNSTIFPSITNETYWYHPDHLGSSSWITDANGNAVQHLHYLPWGEDFVDQRVHSFDGVRYTFSAKEKDSETGLSYFGSRYYSSDLSIWLSVDPMSDKYPSLSPFVYCANNPVKVVDPNGEDYEVVVEGNTITIKATYYTNPDNYNRVNQGVQAWNSQSGLYEYTTDDGKTYSVNFELKVVKRNSLNDVKDSQGSWNWVKTEDFKGAARGDSDGHNINLDIDISNAPVRTVIHEIGHTLGIADDAYGVMESGGNSDFILDEHIMTILKGAEIQSTNGSSNNSNCDCTQKEGVNCVYENNKMSGSFRRKGL